MNINVSLFIIQLCKLSWNGSLENQYRMDMPFGPINKLKTVRRIFLGRNSKFWIDVCIRKPLMYINDVDRYTRKLNFRSYIIISSRGIRIIPQAHLG